MPSKLHSISMCGVCMPHIHNRAILRTRRKSLRNDLTKPEALLWRILQRRKFLGYKFRRQHSIGRYIVDFYCPTLQLAIELDGSQHYSPNRIVYDRERDAYISSLGVTIVRISNQDFLKSQDASFEYLRGVILDHLPVSKS
jgi:very-short-patch-repair endonuclease